MLSVACAELGRWEEALAASAQAERLAPRAPLRELLRQAFAQRQPWRLPGE